MGRSWHTPLLFVFLWSTAYIAIEYCSAHVEPMTFVVVRASITAIVLVLIVFSTKIEWPKRQVDFLHSTVVGILIHGVYAGGFFASIYYGVDLVLCALILSLQPILTVLLSSMFLAEKMTKQKVFGILLGFMGVAIVILVGSSDTTQYTMQYGGDPGVLSSSLFTLSLCFVALIGISCATIVQKKYCSETSPIAGTCIQYAAAAIVMLPIAMATESMQINWNLSFVLGLGWLIIFVSIGAMSLLMLLIKQGEAGSVASLLYLVTPMVAIEAWIMFGDEVSLTALVGMLLCMAGVVVVHYVSTAKPELVMAKHSVSTN